MGQEEEAPSAWTNHEPCMITRETSEAQIQQAGGRPVTACSVKLRTSSGEPVSEADSVLQPRTALLPRWLPSSRAAHHV